MNPITRMGISELTEAYRDGRLDPVMVTKAHLERIEAVDSSFRSYIAVATEQAMLTAKESAERWAQGRPIGRLEGIPIAIKDNIDVAGLPCTAGTEAFRRRLPDRDATAYRQLREAGAVLLGKLNMHEGACGGTTDNKDYGCCINPLMPGYTAGGSSGGSGAAVAAGFCVAALGTDTMGSVRVPASYCGVFGFKPTNGAVSTDGVVPLSFTLDTVGPLARSAADIAAVAEILMTRGTRIPPRASTDWRGMRIGRPRQIQSVDLQPCVAAAFEAFLEAVTRAGAEVVSVDLRSWEPSKARRAGFLVCEAEAAAFWERHLGKALTGLSEDFADMLRFPAKAGLAKLVAAYETLEAVRIGCRQVFAEFDLIAIPTTAETSFPHGIACPANQADCTAFANIARAPALAIPIAIGELPASVQLIAAPDQDHRLLTLAPAVDDLCVDFGHVAAQNNTERRLLPA